LQAIQSLSNRQRKFRYIFIDPPYGSDLILKTIEAISIGSLLLPKASVLVEHSVKKPVPEKVRDLIIHKDYKFGDTVVNLYQRIEV
jgi:16S rRNA G966 N2-methylase RsmD